MKKKNLKKRRKRARKILLISSVTILSLLLLVITGLGFFGYRINTSEQILPNITANHIPLGDKTYEEAVETLKNQGWEEAVKGTLTVTLPKEIRLALDYMEAGVSPTAEQAAETAMEYGHTGSVIDNISDYIKARMSGFEIWNSETYTFLYARETEGKTATLNTAYLEEMVRNAAEEFRNATKTEGYRLDLESSSLIFVKGAGAVSLDEQALMTQVKEALLARWTEMEFSSVTGEAEAPNFAELHDELCKTAENAYYDPLTNTVYDETMGIEFDAAEAERLWNQAENLDQVIVPVSLTFPEMTAEELKSLLFRDILGEQITYYESSTENRINNICLAGAKIDGLIMMPGDVFSYNETVGQRTAETGFLAAGAYADGQVIQEIGGGICQVSSTLFAATLRANLQTISRSCHQFQVTYLPFGIDATVSWPGPDFKFANNTEYPIRIEVVTDPNEKSITIRIIGTNLTGNYCEPVSAWWAVFDETYPNTQIGWGASCYRWIYDKDGNLLDKVYECSSSYDLHKEDINWPPEYYAQPEEDLDIGDGTLVIPGDPVITDPQPEPEIPLPPPAELQPDPIPEQSAEG